MASQTAFTEEDKELFLRFARDAVEHNIGDVRILKYFGDLALCTTISGMGLAEMVRDKAHLSSAVAKINRSAKYMFETKKGAKRTLGSLYCLVHLGDRSMEVADRSIRQLVQHRASGADKRIAKPVLSREEMRALLKHGDVLDKAILSLLFDSGMRMGEFEMLRKGNLNFVKEEEPMQDSTAKRKMVELIEVKVPAGKTGERLVTCIEPVAYLKAWLAVHPLPKDPDAPLWVSQQTLTQIGSAGLAKRIRMVVGRLNAYRKKMGVPLFTKSVNPHNFRHSRATELGAQPGINEILLCKLMGWTLTSKMAATYCHITDEQVKRAVMRTYGYEKKEQAVIQVNRECVVCHRQNPLGEAICTGCGYDFETNTYINKAPSAMAGMQLRVDRVEQYMQAMADQLNAYKSLDPNSPQDKEAMQLLKEINFDWQSLPQATKKEPQRA